MKCGRLLHMLVYGMHPSRVFVFPKFAPVLFLLFTDLQRGVLQLAPRRRTTNTAEESIFKKNIIIFLPSLRGGNNESRNETGNHHQYNLI